MKLASGLKYFQNPLGIDEIVENTHKNVRLEDEISTCTDISCFEDDLNEFENWESEDSKYFLFVFTLNCGLDITPI